MLPVSGSSKRLQGLWLQKAIQYGYEEKVLEGVPLARLGEDGRGMSCIQSLIGLARNIVLLERLQVLGHLQAVIALGSQDGPLALEPEAICYKMPGLQQP